MFFCLHSSVILSAVAYIVYLNFTTSKTTRPLHALSVLISPFSFDSKLNKPFCSSVFLFVTYHQTYWILHDRPFWWGGREKRHALKSSTDSDFSQWVVGNLHSVFHLNPPLFIWHLSDWTHTKSCSESPQYTLRTRGQFKDLVINC